MAHCEQCVPYEMPPGTTVVCPHGETVASDPTGPDDVRHVVIASGVLTEHPLINELVESLVTQRLAEGA